MHPGPAALTYKPKGCVGVGGTVLEKGRRHSLAVRMCIILFFYDARGFGCSPFFGAVFFVLLKTGAPGHPNFGTITERLFKGFGEKIETGAAYSMIQP